MAQFTQLAFIKDLMQGGQESTAAILASLNSSDRTPVIKVAAGSTVTPAKTA